MSSFLCGWKEPTVSYTVEEQRRQREEQAAKEARSKELAKARYEKRKAEKREFTARKKAGLLTPE